MESYNAALDGISLDGKKFFYSNKLNMDTMGRHDEHSGVRTTYLFCCPSKVPGFVTGIGRWIYAKDPRGLYVNLFIGSKVNTQVGGQAVSLRQVTRYPWNGDIDFIFDKGTSNILNLNIRIPAWVRTGQPIPDGLYSFGRAYGVGSAYSISVNGVRENAVIGANGYIRLSRKWSKGDQVQVHFDMPVKRVYTDNRVKANRGRVALMRGPLLYSLEGADNHFDVLRMALPKEASIQAQYVPGLLGGVVTLKGRGISDGNSVNFTAVPYYSWDNRGIYQMATLLIEDVGKIESAKDRLNRKMNTNG
jgi:hypothetical protein